jgi:Na+/alanine symporter
VVSNDAGLGSTVIPAAVAGVRVLGATGSRHFVRETADTLNGLMAIPNPVGVLVSIPLLLKLQEEFFSQRGRRRR